MRIRFGFALFALGNMMLSSCQVSTRAATLPSVDEVTNVDTSLVTGEPCSPPCWQGLEPGKATEEDVIRVLADAPFVDVDSITRIPSGDDTATIEWRGISEPSTKVGSLRIEDGRVILIISILQYKLTLQELVELMGEPAGYYVFVDSPPRYTYSVEVIWPNIGLAAGLPPLSQRQPIPQGEPLPLSGELPVNSVGYYAPVSNLLDYLLATGLSPNSAEYYQSHAYQAWQGFEALIMP